MDRVFNLNDHQYAYHYNMLTVVKDVLPATTCNMIVRQIERDIANGEAALVQHHKDPNRSEYLDEGGAYLHYIYKGPDVRQSFPELMGLYYGLAPFISLIVSAPVVTSPYADSDVNIKYYPRGGGTIGWHFDTNGITVLLYLTTNSEGALQLEIERKRPDRRPLRTEQKRHLCSAGELLIMNGRNVRHRSEPVQTESKAVVVLNYYQGGELGDTWRPEGFDDYVYSEAVA